MEKSKMSGSSRVYNKFKPPKDWANAPEFVPKNFQATSDPCPIAAQLATLSDPKLRAQLSSSYASVAKAGAHISHIIQFPGSSGLNGSYDQRQNQLAQTELCPYNIVGECRYGNKCILVHGSRCEYCGQDILHPFNEKQHESHLKECVQQHERDMELSFAVAQSRGKTCGICMEVVLEKSPAGEQRFGILPSCNHCFCLSCIRRWRQARQFENKIIRACPECRITSDFVCPSRFWVETKQEKEKLISSYKIALSNKACRYYRTGSGTCPFGNKCFYLHALPNGTKVDVGPPRRKPRRLNELGIETDGGPVSIWEFLEDWELQWMDMEDFMDIMDSDISDEWSDVEYQEEDSEAEPVETHHYLNLPFRVSGNIERDTHDEASIQSVDISETQLIPVTLHFDDRENEPEAEADEEK